MTTEGKTIATANTEESTGPGVTDAEPGVALRGQRGIADLLARPLFEDIRDENTRLVSKCRQSGVLDTTSVFIFRIGREWMALPTHRVRRVVHGAQPHTIPHRSETLLGLISVQGELVLCVSLSRLLKIEAHQDLARMPDKPGNFLVANGEAGPVAFPVDESQGVFRFSKSQLRAVPSTLTECTSRFTAAVLPWKDQAVGCLDDELLFYAVDKSLS